MTRSHNIIYISKRLWIVIIIHQFKNKIFTIFFLFVFYMFYIIKCVQNIFLRHFLFLLHEFILFWIKMHKNKPKKCAQFLLDSCMALMARLIVYRFALENKTSANGCFYEWTSVFLFTGFSFVFSIAVFLI